MGEVKNSVKTSLDIEAFIPQIDAPGVKAIALMGSYAKGNAGPFSDIDLVRFVDEQVPAQDLDKLPILLANLLRAVLREKKYNRATKKESPNVVAP